MCYSERAMVYIGCMRYACMTINSNVDWPASISSVDVRISEERWTFSSTEANSRGFGSVDLPTGTASLSERWPAGRPQHDQALSVSNTHTCMLYLHVSNVKCLICITNVHVCMHGCMHSHRKWPRHFPFFCSVAHESSRVEEKFYSICLRSLFPSSFVARVGAESRC